VLAAEVLDAINDILVTAHLGTVCPGGDAVSDNADLALGNGAGGQQLTSKQAQGKKQQAGPVRNLIIPSLRAVQIPHRRRPFFQPLIFQV